MPKLLHETSKEQAVPVYQLLIEWAHTQNIKTPICFDTTATNTDKTFNSIILNLCVILFN